MDTTTVGFVVAGTCLATLIAFLFKTRRPVNLDVEVKEIEPKVQIELAQTRALFKEMTHVPPEMKKKAMKKKVTTEAEDATKTLLQNELNTYFFFFVVEWSSDNDNYTNLSFFPITTEDQLNYLSRYQKKRGEKSNPFWKSGNGIDFENTQVTALQKTPSLLKLLDFDEGDHCQAFYLSSSDTVNLIKKIESKQRACRLQVFSDERDDVDDVVRSLNDLPSAPKFSETNTMLKLLENEHKILQGYSRSNLLIVEPRNYQTLEKFLKKATAKAQTELDLAKTLFYEKEIDLHMTTASYASLTRSLFKPYWGSWDIYALNKKKDYINLTSC